MWHAGRGRQARCTLYDELAAVDTSHHGSAFCHQGLPNALTYRSHACSAVELLAHPLRASVVEARQQSAHLSLGRQGSAVCVSGDNPSLLSTHHHGAAPTASPCGTGCRRRARGAGSSTSGGRGPTRATAPPAPTAAIKSPSAPPATALGVATDTCILAADPVGALHRL